MIKLDAAYITAVTSVFNGVTTTLTTDTLLVSYVELDFVGGNVMAMVQRGTIVNGIFIANMPQLRIQLNANGAFSSTDGSWKGTVPVAAVQAFVSGLTSAFQAFVLGAGAITGTAV